MSGTEPTGASGGSKEDLGRDSAMAQYDPETLIVLQKAFDAAWAGLPSPSAITILMTPALRTSLPAGSLSRVAAIRPAWKWSIWTHGLRRPVISTMALAPSRSRAPVGNASRSNPDVVMFSPRSPGW